MSVKLRLARYGAKNAPYFRIVAIDSRRMRNGLYLENLGTYNPTTDEYVQFHIERIQAWLDQGAVPSDAVKKLCKRFKQGAGKRAVKVEAPAESVQAAPVVETVQETAQAASEPAAK